MKIAVHTILLIVVFLSVGGAVRHWKLMERLDRLDARLEAVMRSNAILIRQCKALRYKFSSAEGRRVISNDR